MQRTRKPSWIEFRRAMLKKFQPFDTQIKLRSELTRIKYVRGQFFQYLHGFNRIINRITEMSEIDKIEKFTNGLRGYTVRRIREAQPQPLQNCIDLASAIEGTYDNEPTAGNAEPVKDSGTGSGSLTKHNHRHVPNDRKPKYEKSDKANIQCYKCNQYGHYRKFFF